jgi:dihydrofolate reductase
MTLALIWAQASNGVIGRDGVMPWHVPEDMARFKQLTIGHPVVMGRRTWDSFPSKFRPLPERRNIVITRQESWHPDGADVVHSVDDALALAASSGGDLTWIIGGAEIYALTIADADRLEVTEINQAIDGDAHAPSIDASFTLVAADPEEGWHTSRLGLEYRFLTYARV